MKIKRPFTLITLFLFTLIVMMIWEIWNFLVWLFKAAEFNTDKDVDFNSNEGVIDIVRSENKSCNFDQSVKY